MDQIAQQTKFKTACDIASVIIILGFIASPWIWWIATCNHWAFTRLPVVPIGAFFIIDLPLCLFGVAWLSGRYIHRATGLFRYILRWQVHLLFLAFIVWWPLHLSHHHWEKPGIHTPEIEAAINASANAAWLRQIDSYDYKKTERLIENFPILLCLSPFLFAPLYLLNKSKWRNILYFSLTVPGIIGWLIMSAGFLPKPFFDLSLLVFGLTAGVTMFWQTPCVFMFVAAFQIFFLSNQEAGNKKKRRQKDRKANKKPYLLFAHCVFIFLDTIYK